MRRYSVAVASALVWLCQGVTAFLPSPGTTGQRYEVQLPATIAPKESLEENINQDFWMSLQEINPIIKLGSEPKQKVINSFGLFCMAVSLAICPIWLMALQACEASYKVIGDDWDPNREFFDGLGKVWAKSFLTLTGSYPSFSGEVELLEKGPHNQPCLFVANHASWLDIPILCTCLDQVFKFVAKGELGNIPCIGHQLSGGQHILIDREDRRSQLRSFKQSIGWIKKGVPIMAFPEGKRSDDGRLLEFKGGLFAIAVKTGVPIVPITISHAHAVMPSNSLVPVQPGGGKLHVHVHGAIPSEGKTEEDLNRLVKDCFLETLPKYQHPAN
ncbi:sn-glycerol-3-phosphate acyltransferase 1, chloroplastic [Seminavis robusta]|uniref:Sn-glycerol-3-phosphate acyltransferase 1, chloroplastic n=1 Tax=Seminavis robusta TaxID=568900 RepID=A0A9N8H5S6_9STRA|nr:sn-glycerol-3-phosphate acyltransferase 1, chloroplastic [Seminavis robusta]|eukprot:Sro151_g069120.1 sn-glycerol-3-phosphate acyltransferase 1, chloroplastic (329) ;mRNA; f:39341-40423